MVIANNLRLQKESPGVGSLSFSTMLSGRSLPGQICLCRFAVSYDYFGWFEDFVA